MWHKPQKSAETQSFSPLLSNINQGNNDFQYVTILNTVLNSPLEVVPEAYAVFSNGTLTFYYDKNKPSGAYGMRTNWDDQWSDVTDKITEVVFDKSFADYRPTSCACWFYGCSNLTIIEGMKEYLKTENVTDMGDMFSNCSSLTTLDVSNFNTEKVTNMYDMFYNCSSLTTLDVSNFKTENVTSMTDMFGGCSSLTTLDVSNFKTDNVTNMRAMFYNCSSLTTLDVSNFNTDNVTDMFCMFYNCSSLTSLDVSNFKTDNVMYMNRMFLGCSSLQTIYVGDNWTTKNVTESEYMFDVCYSLYGGKGTAYNADFIDATYARIDDPENGKPGYLTKKGELPYEGLIPYAVFSDGTLTFYYDKNKPEGAYGMKTGYDDEWSAVANDITKVVFDQSFAGYPVTSCSYWFFNCKNLTEFVDMDKYLNTENVTDMSSMFSGCSSLKSLNLSNFNTSNVKQMGSMFDDCCNLKTIYVGDEWITDAVEDFEISLFSNCYKLYGGKGSNLYDDNENDYFRLMYARIDGGETDPGYFTKNGEKPFESKAFAVLKDATLTFYYNTNKPENALEIGEVACTKATKSNVEKVVFDESFRNYKPKKCNNLLSIGSLICIEKNGAKS